jgi:hypothetical protein
MTRLIDDGCAEGYDLTFKERGFDPLPAPGLELPDMRFRRLNKTLVYVLRGGLLIAGATAFLVAALGVPLPRGSAKDRSVAFPCMDRPCGCHDAADCKEHCCCFSSSEKLAWAAEHEVDPAPFVDDRTLVALETGSCHGHGFAGSRERAAACCADKVTQRHRTPDQSAELLSIGAYRQCTGLAPVWTLLGAALPPAERARCEFQWVVTGAIAPSPCELTVIFYSPPTPPPRA